MCSSRGISNFLKLKSVKMYTEIFKFDALLGWCEDISVKYRHSETVSQNFLRHLPQRQMSVIMIERKLTAINFQHACRC